MEQYPTPQFIEQEGKIVFFMTFKQFFILVGAVGVCALLFYTLPLLFFAIGSVLVIFIAIVIAFLKVQNESVPKMLLRVLHFSTEQKNYVWKKKEFAPTSSGIPVQQHQALQDLSPQNSMANRLSEAKKNIELKK